MSRKITHPLGEWRVWTGAFATSAQAIAVVEHGCYTDKHGVFVGSSSWYPLRESETWKCGHCGQVAPEGVRMMAELMVADL